MYLLAFKNNEEREELYNGAVRKLVRNFSLTRDWSTRMSKNDWTLEKEKKGREDREEVPQTHKNKKKVCFVRVFAKYSMRTFSLNFFLVLQLSLSLSLSLSLYVYNI